MRTSDRTPSFWSGVAAAGFPFEDCRDYSRWACDLLESGYDDWAIRILAGLDSEENLFELRDWHRRVLRELGLAKLSEREIFQAHLRGYAEEFLAGDREYLDLLERFRDLSWDTRDELLKIFEELYYADYHFEEADWGISTLAEVRSLVRQNCHDLIETIDRQLTRPAPKEQDRKKPDSLEPGF